jgi:leucyl/phenylalanyl-tRNA--protein transferase
MFSRVRDASKVALAWLVAALRMAGAELLDCQFITPHLASLGAVEISQQTYLQLLARAGAALRLSRVPWEFPARAKQRLPGFRCPKASAPFGGGEIGRVFFLAGNFIAQSFTHTS